MRHIVLSAIAVLVAGTVYGGAVTEKKMSVSDESLGLSKVGVEADSGLKEKPFVYKGSAPGTGNKRIPRAYDNSPPMIPHDIRELPIITKDYNACLDCHMPEIASSVGAIAIPPTHVTNLRTMKDLKGELYKGRWNCTQCHAPQADLDPAVMNRFKGAYHKQIGGEYKTNLIKTLREGVVEDKTGSFDINTEIVPE